jgi:hypothetical protein
MVLDIAELVIAAFSFMEANIPVTKSTKIKNNTAKITVAIGAKKDAIKRTILLKNPLIVKLSDTDCAYCFSMQ